MVANPASNASGSFDHVVKQPHSPPVDLSASRSRALLALLADGNSHSGSSLAKTLRVSRSAVWKLVGTVRELGIPVESLPRTGYRLPRAIDLLDAHAIESALRAEGIPIESFHLPLSTSSTNQFLVDSEAPAPGAMRVCTTELQSAGRGRRGRSWTAPFGSGICLSVSWQFSDPPPDFPALGLVVGVAVARCLTKLGFVDVQLKWPNDLVWQHRKLGGILIEMRGEAAGPAKVVIGVGLNVRMPAAARLELANQHAVMVTDLHEIAPGQVPSRNELIIALLREFADVLPLFAQRGLAPFREEWQRYDAIANSPVKVFMQTATVLGEARGISANGSLLVAVDGRLQEFVSGEVSVRTVGSA